MDMAIDDAGRRRKKRPGVVSGPQARLCGDGYQEPANISTAVFHASCFASLPALYWVFLVAMMFAYAVLTHFVKMWFVRRWGI